MSLQQYVSDFKKLSIQLDEIHKRTQSLLQYLEKKSEFEIRILKNYLDNKEHIEKELSNNNNDILLYYDSYDVSIFEKLYIMNLEMIFKNEKIIQHILDHMNLESFGAGEWRPIHYICRYSTSKMIRYIVEKNVDLEFSTTYGMKPIHFICLYSNIEMILFFHEKNVNVDCKNYKGQTLMQLYLKNPNSRNYIPDSVG